jgi:acetyltransferase-like isoleucine patch superfamily enzyme
METAHIHSPAFVSDKCKVGKGTHVWFNTQIRENAQIGENCILGKNVYIDHNVIIGNNVKIQNNSSIYFGSEIEEGVFIGPHVCLTNDKTPRAINKDGSLKKDTDWKVGKITVKKGASIGAGSIILPNVTLGIFSMIGAGSVVTKNIPSYGLALGNPARLVGFVCSCGTKIGDATRKKTRTIACSSCGEKTTIECL